MNKELTNLQMNVECARDNMLKQQIMPACLLDAKIVQVLANLKRENFVQEQYKNLALSEVAIPLPGGQHMLYPVIEARLIQELDLNKNDKVLEVGTGSGFVTAILARLSHTVYSLEINDENRESAIHNLTVASINNVHVIGGDGMHGYEENAPYDKIFIGGAVEMLDDKVKEQLKIGGKLVGFIGVYPVIHAVLVERQSSDKFTQKLLFETDVEYLVGVTHDSFKF